jgi:type II secretory pathway component GspD/PulD (secretin)
MKTTMKYFLAAICFAGFIATVGAQNAPDNANTNAAPDQAAPELPPGGPMPYAGGATAADAPETPPSPEALAAAVAAVEAARAESNSNGSTAILPTEALGTSHAAANSDFMPPLTGTNVNALLMNFRNAPLDMVLNYLSDAAGFIIVLDTQVRGNVSVISNHPMTRDEAVDLLNSVLNKNGYAAIRDGRTLTIVGKDDAKTRNIPVKVEANPKNIPNNDEIVTQIIPIRFVEAEQLTKDLSPFVSAQATIVANEAGNSIVITDTQSNIKHLAEIIEAIDNSAEAETEIRVFHLKYANPTDVATELGNIFPSSASGNSTQAPTRFAGAGGGGPGGFFARMMGGGGGQGGGGAAGGSSNDRIKKATQVTAVADARIQAVIVSGPKDLMEEIAGMMKDLDVRSDRDQNVSVISLQNSDPQQVAQVLQSMFSNGTTSRSGSGSSSQNSALQTRAQNSATTMSTTTTSSGIGNSAGGGGGGGGRAGGF